MSEAFREVLEQVTRLASQHPEHQFELIQPYIDELHQARQNQGAEAWRDSLLSQWAELSEARQQACLDMFQHALQTARQATYTPVNDLDLFLEKRLYGIQDEEAVSKGLVSQALKQVQEQQEQMSRKRAPSPPPTPPNAAAPPPGTGPMKTPPPKQAPLPPRAGRTNPLPPHPGRPPEG